MNTIIACNNESNANTNITNNTANVSPNTDKLEILKIWSKKNTDELNEYVHFIYEKHMLKNELSEEQIQSIFNDIRKYYGPIFMEKLYEPEGHYPLDVLISDLRGAIYSMNNSIEAHEKIKFITDYSIDKQPSLVEILKVYTGDNAMQLFQNYNMRLNYNIKSINSNTPSITLPLLDKVVGIDGLLTSYIAINNNKTEILGMEVNINKTTLCNISCEFSLEYEAIDIPNYPSHVSSYKVTIKKAANLSKTTRAGITNSSEFFLDIRTENNNVYIRIHNENNDYFKYVEDIIPLD